MGGAAIRRLYVLDEEEEEDGYELEDRRRLPQVSFGISFKTVKEFTKDGKTTTSKKCVKKREYFFNSVTGKIWRKEKIGSAKRVAKVVKDSGASVHVSGCENHGCGGFEAGIRRN